MKNIRFDTINSTLKQIDQEGNKHIGMEVAKVEGFSDGVFAVAMTLLIYQVVTPILKKKNRI